MSDWVTDPGVIEILCKFGGILPGDEVVLQEVTDDPELDGLSLDVGSIAVVLSIDDHSLVPINVVVPERFTKAVVNSGDWDDCINYRNIAAWRRPVVDK